MAKEQIKQNAEEYDDEKEKLYMDIYDNGLVNNEYKEKFKHLINCFYEDVIIEKDKQIKKLKNKVDDLAKMCNTTNERFVKEVDKVEQLETQIEKRYRTILEGE